MNILNQSERFLVKKATIDEILIDLQKVIDKLSQKILRDKNEIR